MKIVLAGGGSGGPVAPLLAIAETIKSSFAAPSPKLWSVGDKATEDEGKKPGAKFLFIGTKKGEPEKEMIKNYNFSAKGGSASGGDFVGIFCGKLRRYFSWQNFLDLFKTKIGFFQSLFILKKFKPDLIIGAGGYVSVPVVLAGWFLKIPSLIHQQDILPTLSNKILSIFAKKIIVSFGPSLKDFPKNKTIFTGHPVRQFIFSGDKERAIKLFNLEKGIPTLLVLGGGTGAKSLNETIWRVLPELAKFYQVIHITGRGKLEIGNWKLEINERYHAFEFMTDEIADAYAVADVVISRAGVNVLAELAVLGKPTIIIPIPDSHQEANARYFQEKNAAIVLNQKELTDEKFLKEIKTIIKDEDLKKRLADNIKKIMPIDAAQKIIGEILA